MVNRRIVVLAGDGIGPEVTQSALRVLEAIIREAHDTLEVVEAPIGGKAIDETGDPFPPVTRELVDSGDPVLLGAVGGPKWDHQAVRPEQGLLRLRKHMGLFANLRPFEVFPGLESLSPLKNPSIHGVVVRELTGGLYFGEPRFRRQRDGKWEAVDTMAYGQDEIERIVRIGFETAQMRKTPLVSIDKANVLETSRLWRETVEALSADYPEVPVLHRYVDAAAMEMVMRPEIYQVVVTENLFGDILSDLTGGLVGSLGLLGSASVRGPAGTVGLYEPVHGSAPDIAGQGIANPVGAMLSAGMLMGWSWARPDWEQRVLNAIRGALAAGERTRDLGGDLNTEAFTDKVVERLQG